MDWLKIALVVVLSLLFYSYAIHERERIPLWVHLVAGAVFLFSVFFTVFAPSLDYILMSIVAPACVYRLELELESIFRRFKKKKKIEKDKSEKG
jgi:hypothetical protein